MTHTHTNIRHPQNEAHVVTLFVQTDEAAIPKPDLVRVNSFQLYLLYLLGTISQNQRNRNANGDSKSAHR